MTLGTGLQSPRRHVALFLAVTLVPSVLLVGLGWLLFRQDRAAALQQLRDRPAQAADVAITELKAHLAEVERLLADPSARAAVADDDDAAVVVIEPMKVTVQPVDALSYLPIPRALREAPDEVFAEGEALEYRSGRAHEAATSFERLTRSPDAAVRAGAWVRLARVHRKVGRIDAALTAYERAADEDGVAVAGIPVALLARSARLDLLAAARRTSDLTREAQMVVHDLRRGAWPLSRAAYEANLADARRLLEAAGQNVGASTSERLAAAVETWWARHRADAGPAIAPTGSALEVIDGVPIVILWTTGGGITAALAATPAYVQRTWLASIQPALTLQQVRLDLHGGVVNTRDAIAAWRSAAETGLPWTISAVNTNIDAELARLARRRSLWLSGLAALTIVLVAASGVTARAVSREIAAARLQSDFVAAVSHEFRTPLTTLRQLTEALADARVVSESRRQTYYEALGRQTDRLQRLVESLLDFGRMEAGARPYAFEPRDVGDVVRTAVDAFRTDPRAAGREIRFHADSSPVAPVDRDALSLALWNLLDNAVKYSPDGGEIDVDVRREDQRTAISVRDRGLGIPAHERDHVFARFRRGDEALARGIKGTGLGLALVQHIVSAHGGTIDLESAPGAGSVFTMRIPWHAS